MPIIRIELLPGRTALQKARYAQEVTQLTAEILGCAQETVDVIFTEIQGEDWVHAGVPYAPPIHAQR